ncbi:MAG: Imidazolonepropionase [Candidatus Poseidoniaceae archaeon]|nr:MAG: Imidazolonepropionase [Candidatus Poseidoniaceae archaeon]
MYAIVLQLSPIPLTMRTIFYNIGSLQTMDDKLPISFGNAIIVKDNKIESIVESIEEYESSEANLVDVGGRAIVPGFIDAHNHLVWAGDRFNEHNLRMQGHSYVDIAGMGGGIMQTVTSTRESTDEDLLAIGKSRLMEALRNGTTFLEAKSGYGLSTEHELRLLNIVNQLKSETNLPSIHSTWMGAHAVTPNHNYESYTEEILSEQLPDVLDSGLADSADVFCEPGWFSIEQSEDILRASRQGGLDLRMHVDEFTDGGGGELAAELKVMTADHAHHTPMDTRITMMEAGVVTGFLPGTPYFNGDQWPDFKDVQAQSIPFSMATDFNPNCFTNSIPFIGSLVVQRNGISPYDALYCVTRQAARSTPRSDGLEHGVIKEGAIANFNILKSRHWESWCMTPSSSPVHSTCLEGQHIEYQ